MSLDKIRALRETAARMEEMQKQVSDECRKDRKQLRWEAFQKICKYLDDLVESLNGDEVRIKLSSKERIFPYDDYTYLIINGQYYISRDHYGERSKEPISWCIQGDSGRKRVKGDRYKFIDRDVTLDEACPNNSWVEGYIKLIENWQEFKEIIESGVMEYYEDKMKRIRENTQSVIESYEKVVDFEA